MLARQAGFPPSVSRVSEPVHARICLARPQNLRARLHRRYCSPAQLKAQGRRQQIAVQMQAGQSDAPSQFQPAKPTLIDIPVSNNGARCRFVIYKEGLEDQIDVASPGALGGLKSEQSLSFNKQGKCPLLILPGSKGSAIAESEVCLPGRLWPEAERRILPQVVALYLLEQYAPHSKLLPSTPLNRARARQAAQVMDVYITPIQACMYRGMDIKLRSEQIQELVRQLDVIESAIEGPFVLGQQMSHADGALFPTLTWMHNIMPRIFGWKSVFTGRPKLQKLYESMQADPAAKRVMQELEDGLEAWHEKDRWGEVGIKQHVADSSYNWACS